MKRLGIVYHPRLASARAVATQLSQLLPALNASFWLSSAWEEEQVKAQVSGTDLILSIGGDGTLLRVARAVLSQGVPILGINLGKLGFMTELSAEEAVDKLPSILAGEGWVDERAMLQAELLPLKGGSSPAFHALNDVVVGRGAVCRVVYVQVVIDGELLTSYKADGVIISTATGSTGYCLAAGGPILYPQSRDILLKPLSPHLSMDYALVLPPTVTIELAVSTEHQAVLSIDGQVELSLESGDKVKVKSSPYVARFWRVRPVASFYSALERKLKGVVAG